MKRLVVAVAALGAWSALAESQSPSAQPLKNDIGMEFVKIPAGEFMMGCSQGDRACKNDEKPSHRVRLTQVFEMGKFEVTQAQWKTVMSSDPSGSKGNTRPVENVTRNETADFFAKLNAKNDGYRYRLPTEAEWEYAARAGTSSRFYGSLDEIAWYEKNAEDETHPVGLKKPNAWGLYDMIGNVREWVSDTYAGNYYNQSPQDNPTGPVAGQRGGGGPGGGGRGGPQGGRGGGGGARGGGRGQGAFAGQDDNVLQTAVFNETAGSAEGQAPAFETIAQQGRGGGRGGPGGGRGGPGGAPRGGRGGAGGPSGGGPGGGLPIMRGGGWDNPEDFVRVSDRYHYYGPTLRTSDLGFRVVREAVAR